MHKNKNMNWNELTVLITGGTGSFGKKFTSIMLNEYNPKKLIIFSRDELKQHEMLLQFNQPNIRYFIGDVRDKTRLELALHGVDIVVHAAALKQVPACEYNPIEAIHTNILGAKNVIEASINKNVKKIIAISTDKAVNPVNLYGATKLCAEKLFIQSNAYSAGTYPIFSCARYGNVIGSRGSVVPIFKEQKKTGKITITDKRMTRFWITLEKGVRFVIKCIELMQGGEVFVPKIPSMRIMDLAKAMAPDSDIEYIGVRPGEKIHEVLISRDESRNTLELDDMYVIQPCHPWWKLSNWQHGSPLQEGFEFSSDKNKNWLTIKELKEMIETD